MRWLTVVLLLWAGTALAAAPDADDLAKRMNQRLALHPVLRAEFVQEKTMAAFKKPLVTRGHLVFAQSQGIIWDIEAPLRLTYVLGEDRIVEIGADGRSQAKTALDVPGLAQVGKVFRALLGAQAGTLAEIFTIVPEGTTEAWRLVLTPKAGPLGQYLRQIQLAGGRHVERIRIDEASGDATTIGFRNTTEDDVLSAKERQRFGGR